MAETPQGPLSIAADALRTAIASCAAFQSWVSHTQAGSLAHIFIGAIDVTDTSFVRPCAVILFGDDFEIAHVATGGTYSDSGTLAVIFEGIIPTGYGHTDASLWICNLAGVVGTQLISGSDNGSHNLMVRTVRSVPGFPMRASEVERNQGTDYIQMAVEVDYGPRG